VKKYYAYFCFLLLGSLLLACQDKSQSSEKETTQLPDSTHTQSSLDSYSPIFKAILQSGAGMVRGVSIGDDANTIKETAVLAETQPENGKGFTEYFDDTDLNFADIAYLKDSEEKVAAISVDVYVERQTAVDSLMNEFRTYFDKKYGQGKGISKMSTWKLPDGQNQLILQNVSTAKDPGLKIVFAKSGDKLLQ
jgi:hypothetical protein